MPYLFAQSGPDQGTMFPIADEVVRIGRNRENHVALNDSSASRFHAEIRQREGKYYVRDLNSTHGTFVNDVRNNQELLLSDQDVVLIGSSQLQFHTAPVPENTPIMDITFSEMPLTPASEKSGPKQAGETIAFSLPSDTGAAERAMRQAELSEQRLEMISKIAEAMQSVFDLDDLLATLMDTLFDVFHPDRGVVFLVDRVTGDLTRHVTRPADGEVIVSHTVINQAIQAKMSLLLADMVSDERFSRAESIVAESILSAICAPLVCRDRVLGVLYIDTQSHRITYREEDLTLLSIIASNAAIAIDNAILVQEKLEAERLAAIGVAIAGISHYVKNILTGMKGSGSLIEMGLERDAMDMVRKAWPIHERANEKISTLVQDMLTYSKKREPIWEDGNLNDVMREVFDNQSSRATKMGVEVVLHLDEGLPDSRFEVAAIHDTLLNLVGNAIEACESTTGARVVLRTAAGPGGDLCAYVTDSGPGIPEEIQKRIMEPFFSTKGSKGTGLGLAVARKSVEEHGGELVLESEVGKGTRFTVSLPHRTQDDTKP